MIIQQETGSQLQRRALQRAVDFSNYSQRLNDPHAASNTLTVQNLVLLSFRHVGVSAYEVKYLNC